MMTRRYALKTAVLAAAASAFACPAATAAPAAGPAPAGPFKLPPLPYAFDALEPHIDARTMEIHHDKHHAAYVANLNKALADYPDLARKPLEDLLRNLSSIPEKVRTAVRNQGGGHYNHSLFWQMMKKDGGGEPTGELATAINQSFGSFGAFKEKFSDAAAKVFGSGWAWLRIGPDKKLAIETSPNQDSPLMSSLTPPTNAEAKAFAERYGLSAPGLNTAAQPLLGIDVWEHAYYLKYQNRRPEYVAAWFNVINWDFVAEQFNKMSSSARPAR